MFFVFIIVFCAIIALGFGAAAAWSDYTRLSIPNLYVGLVGAAFVPAFLIFTFFAPEMGVFASWKSHLLSGGIMLAATYALFHFKIIGGGDSKLLSVFALWVGLNGLMSLLFFMSLIGGVLGVATLLLKKYKPVKKPLKNSWVAKAQGGDQAVPYGIAIFIGALMAFWNVGYINPSEIFELASITMERT